ncbi:hypothetical protein [Streptomyces sp. NPDC057257]|uniref:hypothetical protein n=1 Tax=Streptomyces sp. NPDC057257 TaxID=3346071 RepID=UPI00363E91DC
MRGVELVTTKTTATSRPPPRHYDVTAGPALPNVVEIVHEADLLITPPAPEPI